MAKFKVGKRSRAGFIHPLQTQREKLFREKKEGAIKKLVKKRAKTRADFKKHLGDAGERVHVKTRSSLSRDLRLDQKTPKGK